MPLEKIRNLSSSNWWKCIEIVNPTTTRLLNLSRFHQVDLFGFWRGGGVGACAPRAPPVPTGLGRSNNDRHIRNTWPESFVTSYVFLHSFSYAVSYPFCY